MGKDLRDIERSWLAHDRHGKPDPHTRVHQLVGWSVLSACVVGIWFAAWAGWGSELGAGLQRLYGVPVAEAPVWLRSDAHLHAMVAALITIWGAWGGHLFTRLGSWPGPAVGIVTVIVDEVLQLGAADRSFEWSDPLAGLIGILIVTVLILVITHRQRRVPPSAIPR